MMKAQIIDLTEWRELLALVEAEALDADPLWVEKCLLDQEADEDLDLVEMVRQLRYPPLYCIKGGKV
jgi:hypothetical protein